MKSNNRFRASMALSGTTRQGVGVDRSALVRAGAACSLPVSSIQPLGTDLAAVHRATAMPGNFTIGFLRRPSSRLKIRALAPAFHKLPIEKHNSNSERILRGWLVFDDVIPDIGLGPRASIDMIKSNSMRSR